ncbi:TetR/AcrR family transcriptional regulator [Streptomyces sp. PT12]|uniref:TetR/AcrR family transcriptional regulator n=1 Tax=Streptomyces sp. PT12 TaxID=1510197 RepID=UPI000DE2F29C|nr:TetR/AcrR family transcriptional regulator [Streptomyces sp. PT12]RBM07316.1 TetR family transcriptional regulator [Streptomyces sp. PT12]
MSSPPQRADARRHRHLLLTNAHAVFGERGTGASLGEIARRAGVSPGTLYRHFPTRDALLAALLRDRLDALVARGATLLRSESPHEALAAWLRSLTRRTTVYPGLPAALLAASHDERSPLHTPCLAVTETGLALIERARDAGAIRTDVPPPDILALTSAIAWLAERTGPMDPTDLTADARARSDRLVALVMAGLTTPRPTAAVPPARDSAPAAQEGRSPRSRAPAGPPA